MQVTTKFGEITFDVGDTFTIYDDKQFRLAVWEIDGVLHLYPTEPVVLATQDADLVATKHDKGNHDQ